MKYILALDQGTTSSRALLIDKAGRICGISQEEFPQYYPRSGWVEHDPVEIWECQKKMILRLLKSQSLSLEDNVSAIGITNQRETTMIWDKNTGKPVYNAIVWQCRRTASLCNSLKKQGHEALFHKKTGLPLDAYFSGTKIRWILDNIDGVRERAEKGELLFGTVDSWLIWNLTGGKVHITDVTNASRTLLYNIHEGRWDEELLSLLDIPFSLLPEVKSSSEIYGYTDESSFGANIPISGCAGDQQAALFGQLCLNPGDVKNTYGTGCFMLMNTGEKPVHSDNGLLTTIAWKLNGRVTYALEGSIFMGGAIIQWLRDNLNLIDSAPQCDELAAKIDHTEGVYLVPAFQGLGAPYWSMDARAELTGMTRATGKEHICRAALESIAFRSKEIIDIMQNDSGIHLQGIKVDGGASRSDILMQIQSDLNRSSVIRPRVIETTALGAAFFAGLAVGYWKDPGEIRNIWEEDRIFQPGISEEESRILYDGWKNAVKKCLMADKD